MIFNSQQIITKLKEEHKNAQVFITDAEYVAPNISWLRGAFYNKMFYKWLSDNQLERWASYKDCDNFAFLFYAFVGIAHAKTMRLKDLKGEKTYQGISVGVIFYKTYSNSSAEQQGVGHAINVIVTESGVKYIEPQNGREIKLNQKEKDSAWVIVI